MENMHSRECRFLGSMFLFLPDRTKDASRSDWWKSDFLYGSLHPGVGESENYLPRFHGFFILVSIASVCPMLHDVRHGCLVDAVRQGQYIRFGDYSVIVRYWHDNVRQYSCLSVFWSWVDIDPSWVQFVWLLFKYLLHFHKLAQYQYDDTQLQKHQARFLWLDRLEFDRCRVRGVVFAWGGGESEKKWREMEKQWINCKYIVLSVDL